MSDIEGKVLVLGAGHVAGPLVRYLLDRNFEITVASNTPIEAEALIDGHELGRAVTWSAEQTAELAELVAAHDLAVSLLPAPFHPFVAEQCLAAGKHMVTASYVSPQMRGLDTAAREAGLTFLNEMGVDPGIDHMSIMRVIDHVRGKGGKLTMVRSCCGGLPAPDANTNPLGYKFSWSPAGVLVAMTGACLFLEDGRRVVEEPGGIFEHVNRTTVADLGEFEYYPNRDSLDYIDHYGVANIPTMFRGTFRYPGWAHFWKVFWKVGLLDRTPREELAGRTWDQVMADLVDGTTGADLRAKVAAKGGVAVDDPALDQAEWLGLLSATPLSDDGSLLDCAAALMFTKMVFGEGERDMIVMKHDFRAEYPDGSVENITSTMIDYGIPGGDSSMARTVSLPAAIGVRLILDGEITARGVHIPVIPEIYTPVLAELAELDITLKEEYLPA